LCGWWFDRGVDYVVGGLIEEWIVIKPPTTQSTPLSNHQQHNPLLYQTTNNIIHSSIKSSTTQSTPLSNHQRFDRGVDYVVDDLIEEWIVLLVV
jgi:hypothetical protein